mmetsp:Transcript_11885/g.37779  ORF Transcript_11885/g.37779 Transcript_11885/m.37779 type:complete len:251 (-) Transcript_11885:960-1712(-)
MLCTLLPSKATLPSFVNSSRVALTSTLATTRTCLPLPLPPFNAALTPAWPSSRPTTSTLTWPTTRVGLPSCRQPTRASFGSPASSFGAVLRSTPPTSSATLPSPLRPALAGPSASTASLRPAPTPGAPVASSARMLRLFPSLKRAGNAVRDRVALASGHPEAAASPPDPAVAPPREARVRRRPPPPLPPRHTRLPPAVAPHPARLARLRRWQLLLPPPPLPAPTRRHARRRVPAPSQSRCRTDELRRLPR